MTLNRDLYSKKIDDQTPFGCQHNVEADLLSTFQRTILNLSSELNAFSTHFGPLKHLQQANVYTMNNCKINIINKLH